MSGSGISKYFESILMTNMLTGSHIRRVLLQRGRKGNSVISVSFRNSPLLKGVLLKESITIERDVTYVTVSCGGKRAELTMNPFSPPVMGAARFRTFISKWRLLWQSVRALFAPLLSIIQGSQVQDIVLSLPASTCHFLLWCSVASSNAEYHLTPHGSNESDRA
jgi:hypothetical protein